MRRTIMCSAATLMLSAGACSAAVAAGPPIPQLPSPSQFVRGVSNPWFPLPPGRVFTYHGVKDGKPAVDVLTVTHSTRTIQGIRASVIRDRLFLQGKLEERTTDWYAQDKAGNVWYLGEQTATLNAQGKVTSTEGSWLTGVNGAKAGIYMPAHPAVGQTGRQEYYKGHAEDQFKVLSLAASVTSPAVSSTHALLTQETTRLEPAVVDHKSYVRGIGTVREESVRGPLERLILVSVRR
jgi:hypothetical protein